MEKYSRAENDFFEAIQFTQLPVKEYELTKVAGTVVSDNVNPLTLRDLLLEEYKIDWLEWLPEVTDITLFGAEKNSILSNKIQAIRACLTTDTPWLEWHIFENCGKAFNHQMPNFNLIQPLSLGECETTMYTMQHLRDGESFSEEVLSYVASVAANENFVYLPDDMYVGKAQPYLKKLIFDSKLVEDVDRAWEKLKGRDLLSLEYGDEDPLHRQIAKIAFVRQYAKEFKDD